MEKDVKQGYQGVEFDQMPKSFVGYGVIIKYVTYNIIDLL